ncbi:hypothetical protein GCM10011511_30770 [Puia dinghuensis]|uniref:Peptidase M56 domain-containing protein n=1 Tax=Puia dinghuensis TaxID=1792502 RepID=A0A8J2UEF0_9BACT|nr:hypothetical protein GCM10011511_30770 [Puia dinghuensis]
MALFAGIVLFATRTSRPALRYYLLSGLFVLFAGATLVTFIWEWNNIPADETAAAMPQLTEVNGRPHAFDSIATGESYLQQLAQFLSLHALLIVSVWGCILSYRLVRTGYAIFYTRYIRDHRSTPLTADWQQRLTSLCARLKISKPVRMLESGLIQMPAVFGHWKPVIFIPAGLLAQLPPDQVEAILAHELAHVRRSDFLINLLQNMVETIFFFNPAVWWLSSLIRQEREHCCDDIAIAQTGDKKQLVRALVSFKQFAITNHSRLAVGFPGDRNSFINRIARIVQNKNRTINSAESLFLALSLTVVGMLTLAFVQHNQQGNGQVPPVTSKTHGVQVSKNTAPALITRDTTPKPSKDTPIIIRDAKLPKIVSDGKKAQVVADTPHMDADNVQLRAEKEELETAIKEMNAKREDLEAVQREINAKQEQLEIAQKETNAKQERLAAAQKDMEIKQKQLMIDREQLEKEKQKLQAIREIMEDIMKQHLVGSAKELKSFSLTHEAFIINGEKQTAEVYQWFKNKYIHSATDAYQAEGQFSVDH